MQTLQIYLVFHVALGVPLIYHVYHRPPVGPNLRRYWLGWLAGFVFWPLFALYGLALGFKLIRSEWVSIEELNRGDKLSNDPRIRKWVEEENERFDNE